MLRTSLPTLSSGSSRPEVEAVASSDDSTVFRRASRSWTTSTVASQLAKSGGKSLTCFVSLVSSLESSSSFEQMKIGETGSVESVGWCARLTSSPFSTSGRMSVVKRCEERAFIRSSSSSSSSLVTPLTLLVSGSQNVIRPSSESSPATWKESMLLRFAFWACWL